MTLIWQTKYDTEDFNCRKKGKKWVLLKDKLKGNLFKVYDVCMFNCWFIDV